MNKFFVSKSGEKVELFPVSKINGKYSFVDTEDNLWLSAELDETEIKFISIDWGEIEKSEINETLLSYFAHTITKNNISGVEDEVSDIHNDDPFSPEDISIDTRHMPIEGVIRRMKQDTLILNPDFQRNEVWDNDKKSKLIESLMLKIPIPMFYVSADKFGNDTVIDGLQRLSAIRDFVLGPVNKTQRQIFDKEGDGLRLTNLEFWTELEGKTMNELPVYLKNRILETQLTFTVVNPSTPEEVQFTIFKRINTGGEPLNAQEIRNAMYGGASSRFLNSLVRNSVFREATDYSVRPQRMQDMELALGFCSFYIRPFESYPQNGSLDTWLSHTMLIMNEMIDDDAKTRIEKMAFQKHVDVTSLQHYNLSKIRDAFEVALKRATLLFGKFAFRKSYEGLRRTPINKSLFSLWTTVLAQLSNLEFDHLMRHKDDFENLYHKLLVDPAFVSSISRHSLFYPSVKFRFDKINTLIKYFINNELYNDW